MEEIDRLEQFLNFIFISTSVLPDGTVVEKRELVDRVQNLKIEIYPNEHPPPHFHVRCPQFNVSVNIQTGEIIKGDLPKNARKKIAYYHRIKKHKLIAIWNKLRPGDCPVGKINIR